MHEGTPRVKQFLLRAEGHTSDFVPGQHVSVAFEDAAGRRRYRPYSLVSQPGTDTLALAVKCYPDGACSGWMHERSMGDTIRITPPSGTLHLRDPTRDAAFLATGTGLTPLLSMLTQYLREGEGQATVVFGERTHRDLMCQETLDLIAASHANVTVRYVLSDEDWPGRTGHVQGHLEEIAAILRAAHVYVCGVPDGRVFTEGWEEGAVET